MPCDEQTLIRLHQVIAPLPRRGSSMWEAKVVPNRLSDARRYCHIDYILVECFAHNK